MLFSLLESEGNAVNAQKTNQVAMEALARQEFGRAQTLFFENARKNPSYQTFNNLGYYLITEGLECKNGKVRNAYRLGFSYLLKSRASHPSFTNSCAIAFALSHFAEGAVQGESHGEEDLYAAVLDALSLGYSDTMQYNLLRLQYRMRGADGGLALQARELAAKFPCEESATLALEIARRMGDGEAVRRLLSEHGASLDPLARLLFLVFLREYEVGALLCEDVVSVWCLRDVDVALVAECYLQTNRGEEVAALPSMGQLDSALEADGQYLMRLLAPENAVLRQSIIQEYREIPPFLVPCCFFGCSEHGTSWE